MDGKKVIFLDIDGVMRPEENVLRRFVDVDELVTRLVSKYNDEGYLRIDKYDLAAVYYDWHHEAISNLWSIIKKTGAIIVLSSSWRQFYSLENMKRFFRLHNLDEYLTELLPYDNQADRRKDIKAYLENNSGITAYVIIDDINLKEFGRHFIDTSYTGYLGYRQTNMAIAALCNDDLVLRRINEMADLGVRDPYNEDYDTLKKEIEQVDRQKKNATKELYDKIIVVTAEEFTEPREAFISIVHNKAPHVEMVRVWHFDGMIYFTTGVYHDFYKKIRSSMNAVFAYGRTVIVGNIKDVIDFGWSDEPVRVSEEKATKIEAMKQAGLFIIEVDTLLVEVAIGNIFRDIDGTRYSADIVYEYAEKFYIYR